MNANTLVDKLLETDAPKKRFTRFKKRNIEIPPEALELIKQRWPEVVRTMNQYDMASGMHAIFALTHDACKVANWPDSEAHKMRDYLIDLMNQSKVRVGFGDVFKIE